MKMKGLRNMADNQVYLAHPAEFESATSAFGGHGAMSKTKGKLVFSYPSLALIAGQSPTFPGVSGVNRGCD